MQALPGNTPEGAWTKERPNVAHLQEFYQMSTLIDANLKNSLDIGARDGDVDAESGVKFDLNTLWPAFKAK